MSPINDFAKAKAESKAAVEKAIIDRVGGVRFVCERLGLNPEGLLRTLAWMESSMGQHLDPATHKIATRWEPAYAFGGRYYTKELSDAWGKAAESSHGPWQIMYVNAHRAGFPIETDPLDQEFGLANVDVAAEWTMRFLGRELTWLANYVQTHPEDKRGPLELVFDKWNSGSVSMRGYRPASYIAKGASIYIRVLKDAATRTA